MAEDRKAMQPETTGERGKADRHGGLRPPTPGANPRPRRPPQSPWQYLGWLLLIFGALVLWRGGLPNDAGENLAYTEFKQRIRQDEVVSVTFSGDRVSGTLAGAADEETGRSMRFVTTVPPIEDPALIPLLEEHDVEIRADSQTSAWWQQLLIGLLPWLLILGLLWYAGRRMREQMSQSGTDGIFGFGKAKAKRFRRAESNATFDDVAGVENAKQDLREITEYLREPERYRRLGAKIPRGILLMGPPGTGKTLLARAVAGEADVPFFSISGSEFIEMFVGVGASRVRDMFESAKKEAPAIIFIDEIDSVGRARGTGLGGGHDEREQTLNQILGEMDGFSAYDAVVVLAATNRPDVLDAALMRPGRFDRKVTLDLPDRPARRAILEIHSRGVSLASDVDLDRIAALTVGFAGADLENLINEAALLAGRRSETEITMATLIDARDRVVLGSERETVLGEEEKRLVAYHEAGHAIVANVLPHADPLDKVTIMPRGRSLGATEQIPEEDRHNLRESYLRDRIGVMLGGRASEQLVFGEVSSGSEQDLKQATQLARRMVTHWGMSDELGPVAFRRGEEHVFLGREMAQQRDFSERTAQIVDHEIRKLVGGIEEDIARLLREHRAALDALADALLEHETLDSAAVAAAVRKAEAA